MNKPSEEEILEIITRILARREFGGEGEPVAQPQTLQEPPRQTQPRQGSGEGAPILLLVAVGVLLFLVLVGIVSRAERSRRLGGPTERGPARDSDGLPPDPLQTALNYAGRGEYANAIVFLFVTHLKALHGAGWIVIEKSKTNLQYEFELMAGGYPALSQFRAFKNVFNGVRYGGYGVDRETYEHWLGFCREKLPGRLAA